MRGVPGALRCGSALLGNIGDSFGLLWWQRHRLPLKDNGRTRALDLGSPSEIRLVEEQNGICVATGPLNSCILATP